MNQKLLITIIFFLSFTQLTRQASQAEAYVGCFRDSVVRDLPHKIPGRHRIETCRSACGEAGFLYAGLQNRGDCYCGNDYGSYKIACEDYCNRPCREDPTQICGGALKNSIYHADTENCRMLGEDACISEVEIQRCHDHLRDLDVDSISNECVVDYENEEVYYTFELTYHNGYKLDQSCLSQVVQFQGQEIPGLLYEEGQFFDGDIVYDELPIDNFSYLEEEDHLFFTVKHTDLEDKYNCVKYTTDEYYSWQCEFSLTIYFVGEEQFTYTFCMTTYLYRDYTNTVEVTVNPNEVIGDCCENILNIETELKFCDNFECENYLDDNLVVERKQNIYVEHSIVSKQFQYYHLEGLQLRLNAFIPEILNTNDTIPGKLIYHFQSNIALPNMVLEAISRIVETPASLGRRRNLQSQQQLSEEDQELLKDDYKLQGLNAITVNEIDNNKNQEEDKETLEVKYIIIIASVCGFILISLILISVCLCMKKKNVNKQQQQQQNNNDKQQTTKLDSINEESAQKYVISMPSERDPSTEQQKQ